MRVPVAPIAPVLLLAVLQVSCGGSGGMLPECGNAVVETGEACDDGNAVACDGCSPACQAEPGHVCGDGVVNTDCGEQCDDGNTDPGDGCDAVCRSEACGNGVLDAGEDCDDGNTVPGDGCDGMCRSEVCGNGVVDAGEDCDDGNMAACDGCSPFCEAEPGWVCGDGAVNAGCGEQCDDGNMAACDGCSPSCETESGYVCGDGEVNAGCGEECDDGNTTPGDGCDGSCRIESGPLVITGDYDVAIDGQDTCGFGTGPAVTPMQVAETGLLRARVDIPIGGAGGECNPQDFDRVGNRLTRVNSSTQAIGSCTVRVDVTTVLDFFADGAVTGTETGIVTEAAGDCSGLNLPCQIELGLSGARCVGCFSCTEALTAPASAHIGVFGAAAGL